jgi:hypothetical protein
MILAGFPVQHCSKLTCNISWSLLGFSMDVQRLPGFETLFLTLKKVLRKSSRQDIQHTERTFCRVNKIPGRGN